MEYREQLKSIMSASGWSQEQLAQTLKVSFATINSWINARSTPRAKAIIGIKKLYLDTVGVESVNAEALQSIKKESLSLNITPERIADNKALLDRLTLYLTYHTNTIEGSTMTLSDVEEVLFEHKVLSNRTAIEQAEARNHQAALHWLLDELVGRGNDFTISVDFILGIHLRLMNGIISGAGQFRTHSVRIMGSHVTLANWPKIPDLLEELVADIKNDNSDMIEKIANVHARFERIHPFSDGNGRTGRLIMLAQALSVGLVPPLVTKERKFAYYKYLELAQTKEDYKPLEYFIAESIKFSDDLLKN
jgi:Fic family protein